MTREHGEAIARAIALMHEHVATPLRLQDLADAAYLSPFHFERVFRAATGLSAIAFASALRVEAAKRLLASGDATVTETCFALGYESLGSFVSRFSRSVGVSPGALRSALARDDGAPVLQAAEERVRHADGAQSIFGAVTGDVTSDCVVWIGAFARGVPDGPPLAGTLVHGPGPFRLDAVAPGTYHVLALGLPRATSLRGYLTLGESARVGKGGVVAVGPAVPARFVTLTLAPPCATDPPILVALPLVSRTTARTE